MGADLRAPFGENCSEGSVAKDGYLPVRIATMPTEWPSWRGHIHRLEEKSADIEACPACLKSVLPGNVRLAASSRFSFGDFELPAP